MSRSTRSVRLAALTATAGLLLGVGHVSAGAGSVNWSSAGGDRANTRNQPSEHKISPETVGDLAVDWVLTTGGDVSATPAVDDTTVYVPDWAGNLYAVDRKTGAVVWQHTLTEYTGIPGDKARATPAIDGNVLVIGNQGPFGGGGKVLGIDKHTGELLWATQVESHFAAIITQSATIFDGVAYVGVASLEEALAAFVPDYPCCSFRGSLVALDVATGQILWKTYMAPAGFSGNAIWGSSPAVDVKRGSVYIATGNNYSVPQSVLDCVGAAGDDTDAQAACLAPYPDNHFDSVLALDMRTGAIKWATRALPFDAWTVQCIFGGGDNCPEPSGPDYDFGQAPALFATRIDGKRVEVVGTGQKSGQYWALNPNSGQVIWQTLTGPGGTAGGLQWGSAVDGERVYTQNANSDAKSWTLPDGSTTDQGIWSGLDAATGEILWQTVPSEGGGASGPVTTANGVVFGCSLDPLGHMYAMDAATGEILWSYASGGSCLSGASISNGTVFWGSGYSNFGFGTPNNKLYAFSLPE